MVMTVVHVVIGKERIVANVHVKMVMRIDVMMLLIVRIIIITKIVVPIARTYEPVHVKATNVHHNTGAETRSRSMHDDRCKHDTTSRHLIIPVPINKYITTGCPHPT